MIKPEHKKDLFLLFDLDGTLWNSCEGIAESWNEVFRVHSPGRLVTADDVQAVCGMTMVEIAQTILPDLSGKEREDLFDICMEAENEYLRIHGGRLFPKEIETLKALREAGYDLAVVSNCQSGYIEAYMESMDTEQYFCDRQDWGSTKLPKAENIRLTMERNGYKKALYIGDTEKDEAAAASAGIPFIHAAYGYGKAKQPAAVLATLADLPTLVAQW